MYLSPALRFRGYWLGLIAWIMLSLLTPAANALSQADQGWMRICSATGVTWLPLSPNVTAEHAAPDSCLCVQKLSPMADTPLLADPALPSSVVGAASVSTQIGLAPRHHLPRAPPFERHSAQTN